ncbi:MAG TPA: Bax inhibitor-1/YccA family protein [Steroidobacteraceae bacterium]|nr:Bax inhibitor-1/YccA family protein [Steroidobacteraceae bacterium]
MPLPVRRTSHPTLNERTFSSLPRVGIGAEGMSLKGTIDKSFLLLVVLMAAAFWPWSQMAGGDLQAVSSTMGLGFLGGFVLGLIVSFKPTLARYLAIPYAALEGLALGGFSAILEQRYHGIAIQAVGLTFAVLAALLIAYRTRLIRVTDQFRAMVVGATVGIMLLYAATLLLGLFHVSLQALYAPTPLGIGISLVIVGVAALNVVLAFDLIERGVAGGAPKYMEWYCAFSLMVTLVWLYLEILRLLALTRRN